MTPCLSICPEVWWSVTPPTLSFSFTAVPQTCCSLKCPPKFSLLKCYGSPLSYKCTGGSHFSSCRAMNILTTPLPPTPPIPCPCPSSLPFDALPGTGHLHSQQRPFLPPGQLSSVRWRSCRSGRPFQVCVDFLRGPCKQVLLFTCPACLVPLPCVKGHLFSSLWRLTTSVAQDAYP